MPVEVAIEGTVHLGAGVLAGVTLTASAGALANATSASDGTYAIDIPLGWSGTITPSLLGYTFSPAVLNFSDVMGLTEGVDFTAAVQLYLPINDLITVIQAHLGMENTTWVDALFSILFRQCVAQICRDTEFFDTSWDNSATGALSLVGNSCVLPSDCLIPTRVEWGDPSNPLYIFTTSGRGAFGWYADEEGADEDYPADWELYFPYVQNSPSKCIITGRRLILDTTPLGVTTGMLTIRGFGRPTTDLSSMVPSNGYVYDNLILSILPDDIQLKVADFILANWPIKGTNIDSVKRQALFIQKWQVSRLEIIQSINERRFQNFSYPT